MDRLNGISKSKNLEVLKALTTNPMVTLDILTMLSKHKDYQVRGVVANPGFYEIPPFMIS
jgi:TusA-related sulfurtransferase